MLGLLWFASGSVTPIAAAYRLPLSPVVHVRSPEGALCLFSAGAERKAKSLSKLGVVWVDDALPSDSVRPWALAGADAVDDSLAGIVHWQGGPALTDWVRERRLNTLIVLTPERLYRQGRYLTNVVSGALPRVAVSVRHTSASAVAALVFSELAMAADEPPAQTLQMIEERLQGSLSGAWLRRVHRLAKPAPKFGQHLRSMVLPGRRGYLALMGDTQRLVRKQTVVLDDAETDAILYVAAKENESFEPLRDSFIDVHIKRVDPVVDTRKVYGARGVEFVYVASRPRAYRALDLRPRCPVCTSALHTDTCPYCHVAPRLQEQLA